LLIEFTWVEESGHDYPTLAVRDPHRITGFSMLNIVELGEAGLRAFGFWLWIFSPKYRAQVAGQWHDAGMGHRACLAFEFLIGGVLGLGAPLFVWYLLTT
jgi:hypothetical protein